MLLEHDVVALIDDHPDEKLMAGATGAIVHISRNGVAYEVEFTGGTVDNPAGGNVYTSVLVTLKADQIRLVWTPGIISS